MTRLGMVVLGITAVAAAIAIAAGVATSGPSQEAVPQALTPSQMAELRSSPAPAKARSLPPVTDDEDGGAQAIPQDGDGEDGPGS
jgi:hypothetical protein